MTLLELCDPLFKYVCFLNRSGRKGAHLDASQVDSDLEAIFSEMRSKANADAGLANLYQQIELPLIFFVDNVIASSPFELSNQWQRLAYKRDRVTGDTDFCDVLDDTLAEPDGPSANARLAVLYACLGLGFTGDRLEDPTARQQKMSQVARRVRGFMELEDRARVTPQAYAHTLTDDLVPPPVGPVWRIAIVLIGLVFVLIAVNGYLYHAQVSQLTTSLKKIMDTK